MTAQVSKLSKLSKERTEPSAVFIVDNLLKNVDNLGFPIYKLLGKFKKIGIILPDEVLERVCKSFITNHVKIKKPWPWLISAIKSQWANYNAERNISESKEFNKFSQSQEIRELIKQVGGVI